MNVSTDTQMHKHIKKLLRQDSGIDELSLRRDKDLYVASAIKHEAHQIISRSGKSPYEAIKELVAVIREDKDK
jgi:hypothetical protein